MISPEIEWVHSRLVPSDGEFEVWAGEAARRVGWVGLHPFRALRYLDCTHPLQNGYLDPGEVLAWRRLSLTPA